MPSEKNLFLNLSVADLLEIYHQAPKVLLRCAIKVSIKKESLQNLNQEAIILEKIRNGNYWVISTEDANIYWLLPKNNLKVNTFEYQSVQCLFECQGYQPDTNNYFTVKQPARVSFTAKEWKLEKKGILEFTQTNSSDNVESGVDEQEEFQQFQVQLEELRSQLTEAKSEREQLQSRINQMEDNLRSKINNLSNQLTNLSRSVQKIENQTPKKEIQKSTDKYEDNHNNPSLKQKPRTISSPAINKIITANIADIYNNNPASLPNYIEVLETKKSIEKRWLGHNQQPIFEQVAKNQGNYLIVNVDRIYFLVPKVKLKVTEYLFNRSLIFLFDCDNYSDNYSKFTLIKPAEVTKSGENWELKEKGILEFE